MSNFLQKFFRDVLMPFFYCITKSIFCWISMAIVSSEWKKLTQVFVVALISEIYLTGGEAELQITSNNS